jgi:hypothetical protein
MRKHEQLTQIYNQSHQNTQPGTQILGYLQRWRLKSETQTVGWVFIGSSPPRRKNFISNGDPVPSIVHGAASPRPLSRRTSLTSPRGAGAGATSAASTGGEKEKERRSRGGTELSSSWSRRRSVFDVGTTGGTGGEGAEESSWGRGVELKLESPPPLLCLRWELYSGVG